jgi:hypothetical protein
MLFERLVDIFELVDDFEEGSSRDALSDNNIAFFEKVAALLIRFDARTLGTMSPPLFRDFNLFVVC